jgi:hypothetical protein
MEVIMKSLPVILFWMAFSLCFLSNIQAAGIEEMKEGVQPENVPNMVTGEVKNMEGEWCVVQDTEGNEWKIKVDDYTDTIGNVMSGVTIMAMIEEDGHAKEVKVLQE